MVYFGAHDDDEAIERSIRGHLSSLGTVRTAHLSQRAGDSDLILGLLGYQPSAVCRYIGENKIAFLIGWDVRRFDPVLQGETPTFLGDDLWSGRHIHFTLWTSAGCNREHQEPVSLNALLEPSGEHTDAVVCSGLQLLLGSANLTRTGSVKKSGLLDNDDLIPCAN
ncbi:MAG TPA: hypothetical protein VFT91_07060 [Dehalococcoidia bacterium]|nr:hypothetical protein [Dehalococcoidia bacterium]